MKMVYFWLNNSFDLRLRNIVLWIFIFLDNFHSGLFSNFLFLVINLNYDVLVGEMRRNQSVSFTSSVLKILLSIRGAVYGVRVALMRYQECFNYLDYLHFPDEKSIISIHVHWVSGKSYFHIAAQLQETWNNNSIFHLLLPGCAELSSEEKLEMEKS